MSVHSSRQLYFIFNNGDFIYLDVPTLYQIKKYNIIQFLFIEKILTKISGLILIYIVEGGVKFLEV